MQNVMSPTSVLIQVKDTGKTIGSQTGFLVNVDRRKLPILQLGSVDPVGFGRGFRLISGTIDYVILDSDLMIELIKDYDQQSRTIPDTIVSQDEFNVFDQLENAIFNNATNSEYKLGNTTLFMKMKPVTLDMLQPIDIVVYGVDSGGTVRGMLIEGLEFTSTSYAITINDVAIQQRVEWIARSATPWA